MQVGLGTLRVHLKGGNEFGALTKWRRVFSFKSGVRRLAKRCYSRRLRHAARHLMRSEVGENAAG